MFNGFYVSFASVHRYEIVYARGGGGGGGGGGEYASCEFRPIGIQALICYQGLHAVRRKSCSYCFVTLACSNKMPYSAHRS